MLKEQSQLLLVVTFSQENSMNSSCSLLPASSSSLGHRCRWRGTPAPPVGQLCELQGLQLKTSSPK